MMYCKVCFDRDGSLNSKTVQAACINEKTGVRFETRVCEICSSLGQQTRVTCRTYKRNSFGY